MNSIEDRIKAGIKAIAEARSQGKDTENWEQHLFELVHILVERTKLVRVRMGRFGFCDCLISTALCSGCWKVKNSCSCEILDVDPEKEINERYAQFRKRLATPLTGNGRNEFNA